MDTQTNQTINSINQLIIRLLKLALVKALIRSQKLRIKTQKFSHKFCQKSQGFAAIKAEGYENRGLVDIAEESSSSHSYKTIQKNLNSINLNSKQ